MWYNYNVQICAFFIQMDKIMKKFLLMTMLLAQGTSSIECMEIILGGTFSYIMAPFAAGTGILARRYIEQDLDNEKSLCTKELINNFGEDPQTEIGKMRKEINKTEKLSTFAKWSSFLCASAPYLAVPIITAITTDESNFIPVPALLFGLCGPYISMAIERSYLLNPNVLDLREINQPDNALSYLNIRKSNYKTSNKVFTVTTFDQYLKNIEQANENYTSLKTHILTQNYKFLQVN